MSWHEMQTVNDRKCPWAWSRPKVMLNIALAVLFTTGAILVGFMFPAAADERPPAIAKLIPSRNMRALKNLEYRRTK